MKHKYIDFNQITEEVRKKVIEEAKKAYERLMKRMKK